MKQATTLLCIVWAILFLAACGPKGGNPNEKRQAVRDMAQDTLVKLHAIEPQAKADMNSAVGVCRLYEYRDQRFHRVYRQWLGHRP